MSTGGKLQQFAAAVERLANSCCLLCLEEATRVPHVDCVAPAAAGGRHAKGFTS